MEIIIYPEAKSTQNVKELLEKLKVNKNQNPSLLRSINHQIELLKERGTRLPKNICEHLEDGIYEIKPSNLRILFFVEGDKVVLTHYFIKKSQKTPKQEIEKAKRNRSRY